MTKIKLIGELNKMINSVPKGVKGYLYFTIPKKYEHHNLEKEFIGYIFEYINDDIINDRMYLGSYSFMWKDGN
jgi:hypothetical protein